MHSQWEDIDAGKAKRYLTGAQTKRTPTASTVAGYARDMCAGAWLPTHQGIAFFRQPDGSEVLGDGAHRMLAVIEAGKTRPGITVRMLVTRDVPPEAFEAFDIGRTRTAANMVQAWFPSMRHYPTAAAIARRGITYTTGHPWSRYQCTKHELRIFLQEHPRIADAAAVMHGWPLPKGSLAPSAAGFCWWVFTSIDADEGAEFMDKVKTGANLGAKDPILVLRQRLIGRESGYRVLASRVRRGREPDIAIALTVMAWDKWRDREETTRLQISKPFNDENFPCPRELVGWTDPEGILKRHG